MISIKTFNSFIKEYFNKKRGCSWDVLGPQNRKMPRTFAKVLVCLDVTQQAVEFAINKKIKVIISHHPFMFYGAKTIKKDPYKKTILKLATQHHIAFFAIHTNYDASYYGINYEILKKLKASFIVDWKKNHIAKKGFLIKSVPLKQILCQLKTIFQQDHIYFHGDLEQKIKNVTLLSGAVGNALNQLPKNADLLITGEIKWNDWIKISHNKKTALIVLGHMMEDYFTEHLASLLNKKYKNDLEAIPYHITNPIKIFTKTKIN